MLMTYDVNVKLTPDNLPQQIRRVGGSGVDPSVGGDGV